MEELADAIEDAQYVNAIASQDEGPRPVIRWETPDSDELERWEALLMRGQTRTSSTSNASTSARPLGFEWTCQNPIGYFLFSSFVKDQSATGENEFPRMNFCEEVLRFKAIKSKQGRLEKLVSIGKDFLGFQSQSKTFTETTAESTGEEQTTHLYQWNLPHRTEINETSLCRAPDMVGVDDEALRAFCDFPIKSESCIGLKGLVRQDILKVVEEGAALLRWKCKETFVEDYKAQSQKFSPNQTQSMLPRSESTSTLTTPQTGSYPDAMTSSLFDKAEAVIMESLKRTHWDKFVESPEWLRCRQLLWYQDRPVIADDFFVMRVLGRGGFGLVNACKKGTSGKLYAMKVMNKRRIKLKKSEQLALNERQALAAVESKFVISLSYSFQSATDVYLILDLMTGGDLGFHLHQRGCFSKRECIYYAARIMLGLQHLHDQNYVYRDLKPENCLLSDDGRVKITDLGLAVQMTPALHGAAGTRGYWAPEMLRRDPVSGKRCTYDHMVDWFSLGCCLAEFISGSNPFRSERALQFGNDKGKSSKEKAIDCATLEMEPEFRFESGFDLASSDLCKRLLDKNEKTRLGGAENIMKHAFFAGVNWDSIIQDKKKPPFVPAKDVNAASQSEIGTFAEDKAYQETFLTPNDNAVYSDWDWTNSRSYTTEVLEFLVYERQTGEPLVPLNEHATCCCGIS